METITDRDRFAQEADTKYGYAPADEVRTAVDRILESGQDVVLYSNHDLGSLGQRPLCTVQAIERTAPTPRQAGDTDHIGFGWRYLPELRLTITHEEGISHA
jgi:hypothetical protein